MARNFDNFMLTLLTPIIIILSYTNVKGSSAKCVWYNFGDSNSDTGTLSALLGIDLNPPYGQLFFQGSGGRFSNGRVYLDYICEALMKNCLSAYPEPLGSNFSGGANFATSTATAAHFNSLIFSLHRQVEQFGHFQKRLQKLASRGEGPMVSEQDFQGAVYGMDIGQNDLYRLFENNWTYQIMIDDHIPKSIEAIQGGIKVMYELGGARKFWISNTGPLGCLPSYIELAKKHNISKFDKVGCVPMYSNSC